MPCLHHHPGEGGGESSAPPLPGWGCSPKVGELVGRERQPFEVGQIRKDRDSTRTAETLFIDPGSSNRILKGWLRLPFLPSWAGEEGYFAGLLCWCSCPMNLTTDKQDLKSPKWPSSKQYDVINTAMPIVRNIGIAAFIRI